MRDGTLSDLERLRDGLPGACERAVRNTCEAIRAEGAALCPVQSGALRQSIACETGMEGATASGRVTVGAAYAKAVELGTLGRPAKPFLHPAFAACAGELAARLGDELNDL